MLECKVKRSARKSVSVTISPENEITVRCPKYFSESQVEDFLRSKAHWIENIVKSNNLIIECNKGIFAYKEIYVYGKKLPLIISDKDVVYAYAVYVKAISHIKKLFIDTFKEDFLKYAKEISDEIGIKTSKFSLRAYKSKWGCCDRKGNITLNYLLLMLPVGLQRYVIIHELCHNIYFNHSKLFWQMVGSYEPDYRAKRKELKRYNFITNLY